jgi:hypothetical protein
MFYNRVIKPTVGVVAAITKHVDRRLVFVLWELLPSNAPVLHVMAIVTRLLCSGTADVPVSSNECHSCLPLESQPHYYDSKKGYLIKGDSPLVRHIPACCKLFLHVIQ